MAWFDLIICNPNGFKAKYLDGGAVKIIIIMNWDSKNYREIEIERARARQTDGNLALKKTRTQINMIFLRKKNGKNQNVMN